MYTLEDLQKGYGLLVNGITKIYVLKNGNFETCGENDYMNCGHVWGYGHWEGNIPVIEQC